MIIWQTLFNGLCWRSINQLFLPSKVLHITLLLYITAFSNLFPYSLATDLLLAGFQNGGQIPLVVSKWSSDPIVCGLIRVSSGSSQILCIISDSASPHRYEQRMWFEPNSPSSNNFPCRWEVRTSSRPHHTSNRLLYTYIAPRGAL